MTNLELNTELNHNDQSTSRDLESIIRPLLVAKKDTHAIHRLFAYPAKFQSQLPAALINTLSDTGDLVCDPFSGGGTTAATASILGRKSYAIDLNPIGVMISKAKTTPVSMLQATKIIQKLKLLKPVRTYKNLTKDEVLLMGDSLSSAAESVWQVIDSCSKERWRFLVATVLFKRIKLACRRDKTHLRTASFSAQIEYMCNEIVSFAEACETETFSDSTIDMGSNHEMDLKKNSVDLIVTSPPYPGVDVEYNLIQLQRRDLNRCYRSDLGIRLAETVLKAKTKVVKKDLCDGGSAGNYWSNSEGSLKEMARVLKSGHLAFLYVGFKTDLDRLRYEKLCKGSGFDLEKRFTVYLGKERVASSRGLYHGKDTAMMQLDYLYMLRKR